MNADKTVWLIEDPKTNEWYYGVKDLEGHPIFGKNANKSIAQLTDKESAWEHIINDSDLCELGCIPTEHIFLDNRITHISSDKPLNQEQVRAINELASKADEYDAKQQLIRIMQAGQNGLYDELIDKHIQKMWESLEIASVIYFVEKGKINAGFRANLRAMLREHDEICEESFKPKPSASLNERAEAYEPVFTIFQSDEEFDLYGIEMSIGVQGFKFRYEASHEECKWYITQIKTALNNLAGT